MVSARRIIIAPSFKPFCDGKFRIRGLHHSRFTTWELKNNCHVHAPRTLRNETHLPHRRRENRSRRAFETLDIDSVLSLACEVLLCIAVNRSTEDTSDARSLGRTEEIWPLNKSLRQFVETIPIDTIGAEETASQIKASQFNVRHLERHVGVKIEWTRNIHEHLLLDITTSVKKLYVFELAGFLETTYETGRGEAIGDALKDKSKLGLIDSLKL